MRRLKNVLVTAWFLLSASLCGAQETQSDNGNLLDSVFKDFVIVKGGTFVMGATDGYGYDDERPTHEVTLSSFKISKYEVTQKLWNLIMDENPSSFQGDSLPVNNVSWDECQTFIAKLNEKTGKTFRLPTEAEWEFAARGGINGKDLGEGHGYQYAGGYDNIESMDSYVWYKDNADQTTHKVGTKEPNELGLYDMSGNVCEYVQDFFSWTSYTEETQQNPKGVEEGDDRVYRGGSYERPAWQVRLASRFGGNPTEKRIECGLRLALNGAKATAKVLVVTTTDGTETRFKLNQMPLVKVIKPYVVVKANGTEVNFELEKMLSFKYENMPDDPTNIISIDNSRDNGRESVNFSKLPANATVSVYSLDGKLLYSHRPTNDKSFALPFNSLQRGVNIVKVNGITYKIMKP